MSLATAWGCCVGAVIAETPRAAADRFPELTQSADAPFTPIHGERVQPAIIPEAVAELDLEVSDPTQAAETLMGHIATGTIYREHLDYRAGRGVFQPGVNFYFASELTY